MRSLIIAEKPELGRAIAAAIDGPNKEIRGVIQKQNVVITWAYGHLLRLCEPEEYNPKYKKWKKEDLPIYFENWKLVPDNRKKERVEQILSLMKQCDQIIHAGDPDDEGQFLIDELLLYAQNTKPVKRVYINDNTAANIKKAFHELTDNDETLLAIGRSAYARAVADYIVGINYSRLFSLLLKRKGMSVGRVQSPTLGLIVSRDEAIDQHRKQTYYEFQVAGDIDDPKVHMNLTLKPNNALLEDTKHILHQDILEEVKKDIEQDNKREVKVEEKYMDKRPPLPFNLAKLQAHMNTKFGFDLSKTDQITQTLRDKYQAITYNRSDSQYLKEEHYHEANKVLPHVMAKLKETYPVDYTIHSDCFNDKFVTAHHAIIPTLSNFNLHVLSPDEKRVYEEITRYYIMQFLSPIKKRQLSASIHTRFGDLKATSTFALDDGYKAHFQNKEEGESNEDSMKFDIPKGTYSITLSNGTIIEKVTNPPKRYTQATLIKDMTSISKYVKDKEIKEILKKKDKDKKGENGSIGTSATRSQIVEILIKRQYVEMKGKNIISTQLGKEFYHILPDEIKKPDLTAKWWVVQEDIKEGKADVKTLVDSVLAVFRSHLTKDYSHVLISGDVPIDDSREEIGKCLVCGNKVVENSKGYGCVNYHNGCKFAIWKDERFFQSIHKDVSPAMAQKLLKDRYCLVNVKKGEESIVKILQIGIAKGKAIYRLLDVPDTVEHK